MMVLATMVLAPYALKLYSSQQSTAVRPYALKRNDYASMDGHYRMTQEQEWRDSDPNRPLEHRPNVQMLTEIAKAGLE